MFARLLPVAFLSALAAAATAALGETVPIEAGSVGGGIRDLGPAPMSQRVRIAVVLDYHHAADLDALIAAQADPRSALYHRFLTPAQFRDYFAPTAAEYGRVVGALRRGGFTITHAFANRTVVDATAPAPVAARYFATAIDRVVAPGIGATYTNVRAGFVPPEIASTVLAVAGLDAATRPQKSIARLPRFIHPARANVRQAGEPVFGPDGGYGPLVYINSYALPAANGKVGQGRASGVATDNDFLDGDLSGYLSYFGIKRTGPASQRVLVDGGPPPGLGPDSDETTLDVETIVSLAPGTALYVYEAPYDEPTNGNFIDIYNQVVSDNLVDTLNSSYTYCEKAIRPHSYPVAINKIFAQGNALGITFHAASGDSGSYSYGCNNKIHIGEPVDAPNNVAVGGTSLSVNSQGQETGEVGWDGTGGGISDIFKVPAYQQGVPNIIRRGRNIPDLAFDADPGTGESFYFDGGFDGPIGGTSLASPIFGAALTEIDQLQNARAGAFNVTLYKTWLANGYTSGSTTYFRDITVGSIPPYGAKTGYDQMSGIGAMLVTNFAGLLK
jgi:subtilase family serine protease